MDTRVLDRELALALEKLRSEEELLRWAARRTGSSLADELRAWISAPAPVRVIRVATHEWRYRGSRMHDHTDELGRQLMELREDTLGPAIRAARALLGEREVVEHALAHPGDAAVVALAGASGIGLPREVAREISLAHPANRVERAAEHQLTFLAPHHRIVVIDRRSVLLDGVRPEILELTRSARFVLLRLEAAPHYARVIDLDEHRFCAPERYSSGPDRTVVSIDESGVDYRTSRPDRPLGPGTLRRGWHELDWHPLARF